jgi:hypothetical protein
MGAMPPRQLEIPLVGSPGTLVVTAPLRRHRRCNGLIERMNYVRRYFPELDGETIKVGLTRAAAGMAVPGGNEIWLNPSRISCHTIAHEFVHLLQRRGLGIPQGERSCDVFSLARHWTLNDVAPSYVRLPQRLAVPDARLPDTDARMIYEVAGEAIRRRGDGLRNYIAFFESRMAELTIGRTLTLGPTT